MPFKRSWLLHCAGLALLALAWFSGWALEVAGPHRAVDYPLALLTFLLASAGVAFVALGPRLFRKVMVADRWLPHVPSAFREHENATARHDDLLDIRPNDRNEA